MVCQKSDCFIVARKGVKASGAKGAASYRSRRGSIRTQDVKTYGTGRKGNKESVMELATEGNLKSRMRENCTSGSVRGAEVGNMG